MTAAASGTKGRNHMPPSRCLCRRPLHAHALSTPPTFCLAHLLVPLQRKVAALEVEQVVKRLASAGEHHRIRMIIDKLIAEYAFSPQANHRKVRHSLDGPSSVLVHVLCLNAAQLWFLSPLRWWTPLCHSPSFLPPASLPTPPFAILPLLSPLFVLTCPYPLTAQLPLLQTTLAALPLTHPLPPPPLPRVPCCVWQQPRWDWVSPQRRSCARLCPLCWPPSQIRTAGADLQGQGKGGGVDGETGWGGGRDVGWEIVGGTGGGIACGYWEEVRPVMFTCSC